MTKTSYAAHWLFGVSAVYLVAWLLNLNFKFCSMETVQFIYVVVLGLPLFVRPLARWLRIKPLL